MTTTTIVTIAIILITFVLLLKFIKKLFIILFFIATALFLIYKFGDFGLVQKYVKQMEKKAISERQLEFHQKLFLKTTFELEK